MTTQTKQNPNNAIVETRPISPMEKFKAFARSDMIVERFKEILGDRGARSYISSVVLAVANSDRLQECTHASIISSALRAATLSLSCDPAIGQAYLVPFGKNATFVIGYKGLRDMALRTNKYRFLHADKIYTGQSVEIDPLTGRAELVGQKEGNEIAGWVASFELTNGFKKTLYMTREEIHEHAKKYSKGYARTDSVWKLAPEMMEKKTVLRQLLAHWGVLEARDQMFMSMYDEGETEELNVLEAEFIPVEKPAETEAEIMAALGYQAELIPA